MRKIASPLSDDTAKALRAGESVLLSGVIYVARDAAHKRIAQALFQGSTLPFDIRGQTIYYAGPCPAAPGEIIGSCGPTTSSRMDSYTPQLLAQGLRCMIGKGQRSRSVIDSMIENGAVYLAATGGAGALYAGCVVSCDTVAYAELGSEALLRLTVRDMPLIVAIDASGRDQYALGKAEFCKNQ